MPAKDKKAFMFSLKPADHAEFKRNCAIDFEDMSELVSRFVVMYNQKTKIARAKNNLRNG